MIKRKRIRLLIGFAAMAMAAVAALFVASRRPSAQVMFPDGIHRVDFVEACVSFDHMTMWRVRRLLEPWIPQSLASWAGPVSAISLGPDRNRAGDQLLQMVFQIEETSPNQVYALPFEIEIEDSHGFRYRSHNSAIAGVQMGFQSIICDSFPRYEPQLRAFVYEHLTHQRLFELNVANPLFEATPKVAATLPASQTIEPVTVTVEDFVLSEPTEQDSEGSNQPPRLAPRLNVSVSDDHWTNHVAYGWVEDRAGVRGAHYSLSPFEPWWRVSATIQRTAESGFTDREKWVVDPVPWPLPDGLQELNLERQVDAISFQLRFVFRTGDVEDAGGKLTLLPAISLRERSGAGHGHTEQLVDGRTVPGERYVSGRPWFHLVASAKPTRDLILIVKDQDGRMLSDQYSPSGFELGDQTWYPVQFTPGESTMSVQLTVIVNHPRQFEFLVRPPDSLRQPMIDQSRAESIGKLPSPLVRPR